MYVNIKSHIHTLTHTHNLPRPVECASHIPRLRSFLTSVGCWRDRNPDLVRSAMTAPSLLVIGTI